MKSLTLLLGFGCAAMAVGAQAQVLLEIDVSNPASITFTATSANSAADATIDRLAGVTLMGFFTADSFAAPQLALNPTTGLTASGLTLDQAESTGPNNGGVYTGRNFSVYGGSTVGTMLTFQTTSQAFAGAASVDFISNPSWFVHLPELGATGDIKVGGDISVGWAPLGATIGQWQVVNATAVPEPATVGLAAGLALGGFAFLRRRLAKA